MAIGGVLCLGRLVIDDEDCGRAVANIFVPGLTGVPLNKVEADPVDWYLFTIGCGGIVFDCFR